MNAVTVWFVRLHFQTYYELYPMFIANSPCPSVLNHIYLWLNTDSANLLVIIAHVMVIVTKMLLTGFLYSGHLYIEYLVPRWLLYMQAPLYMLCSQNLQLLYFVYKLFCYMLLCQNRFWSWCEYEGDIMQGIKCDCCSRWIHCFVLITTSKCGIEFHLHLLDI